MKFPISNLQFPTNFQFSISTILNFLVKLFLFILPWQTIWIYQENYFGDYKNQFGTLGFYGSEFLLWIIILLFIVWYWQKYKVESIKYKGWSFSKDKIFVFSILLFTVYCFLSSFWALDFSVAWQQALRVMGMFLLFFVLYLGPLSKKEIMRWFILGSILPIILGLFQFIFQLTFASKYLGLAIHPAWEAGSSIVVGNFGRLLRTYGSFPHPNIFGGYLFIILLAGFLFFNKKEKLSLVSYLFLGFTILTMFFTFSRAALLASGFLFLGFLVYSFVNKNKIMKKLSIFSLVLFIALLFSLWPVFQSRLSSGSINEVQSIEERTSGIGQSLFLLSENKWFGVGISNFTFALHNSNPNLDPWVFQPVHNVGLLIFTELGIVGSLLFILVIISSVVYFRNVVLKKDFFWLVYAIFCFIILMFFDHYLYSFYIGLMLNSLFFSLVLAKD